MGGDYSKLIYAIIKYQESIVGPLAWQEASKVPGLSVSGQSVTVGSGAKKALEVLVQQYSNLFGQASVEACKDAIHPILPKLKNIELPPSLL